MEDLEKGVTEEKISKQKAHVLLESYKVGSLENDLVSPEINMFPFNLYASS